MPSSLCYCCYGNWQLMCFLFMLNVFILFEWIALLSDFAVLQRQEMRWLLWNYYVVFRLLMLTAVDVTWMHTVLCRKLQKVRSLQFVLFYFIANSTPLTKHIIFNCTAVIVRNYSHSSFSSISLFIVPLTGRRVAHLWDIIGVAIDIVGGGGCCAPFCGGGSWVPV